MVAIEVVLILKLTNVIETFSPDENGDQTVTNTEFYWMHIDRLVTFLIQDIIFGYIWLFFRFPEDVYQLYGEMCKALWCFFMNILEISSFSIFQSSRR